MIHHHQLCIYHVLEHLLVDQWLVLLNEGFFGLKSVPGTIILESSADGSSDNSGDDPGDGDK